MVGAAALTDSSPTVECPYVGLHHYTEEYADRFFGRDDQCAVIIGNLRAARLTLLYAESGVGKSSLLRAGVAARLRARAHEDAATRGSPRFVPVVVSAWSDQPVAELIDAVDKAIRPFLSEESDIALARDRLDAEVDIASTALDATLLVILDQFEEYFNYQSADAYDFPEQLARCIKRPELRVNFLISIREDAYAGLGGLFEGHIANVYDNSLHLEYLNSTEARDAIEKPLERTNEQHPDVEPFAVDDELVTTVLKQPVLQVLRGQVSMDPMGHLLSGSRPGRKGNGHIETTHMQLVMKRLWDEEIRVGSHHPAGNPRAVRRRRGDNRDPPRQVDGCAHVRSAGHCRLAFPPPCHQRRAQDRIDRQGAFPSFRSWGIGD